METSAVFGARWARWAARLGIDDPARLSVLADGAESIWDQGAAPLPGATEVLDISHACEPLADASKAPFGAGTAAASTWLEGGRSRLWSDGWGGLGEQIGASLGSDPPAATQAALDALTTSFSKHHTRLNYAHRLHTGQSIGSGMVEGAAKNLIGKRLKPTGARWSVGNVPKMGQICCLSYTDGGAAYWDQAA